MKEPNLILCGHAKSLSRSLSPVGNRDGQVLSPSAVKARNIRESRKVSWEGYENLIKSRNDEVYSPGSVSPAPRGDSPPLPPSAFSSRSPSPEFSSLRDPSSPENTNQHNLSQPVTPGPDGAASPAALGGTRDGSRSPPPTTRRPSKRQSLQSSPAPVTACGKASAPSPDAYAVRRSKSHVRFTQSLPKLPDELLSIQRSGSPVDHYDGGIAKGPIGTSPVPGFGHGHGRPSFLSSLPERGRDGERRAFYGDNYGYGDAALSANKAQEPEHPIKVTITPRVPGDEAWRDDEEINEPKAPVQRLDAEGLAFKIPDYLDNLRGTSQEGERPAQGSRLSNIAGVQVAGSHRRSTFIRAVEAVTGLSATPFAPSTEKITPKYVTTAAKKNSTVIVPVNAKQWLLQSLKMKDWELKELFDQMERIPQLAADHVREVRAEWESLEARSMKVPPEAELLLRDQQLLEKTKTLLRRFIHIVSEEDMEEQQQLNRPPPETPEASLGFAPASEQETLNVEEFPPPYMRNRDSMMSSPTDLRTQSSPTPYGQRNESVNADLYLRKPFIGKPVCPGCGRLDPNAPNTRILGGMLPRESTYQSRGPSPIPKAALPSFIPYDDYVVRQSVVKPSGKSDQFKSTYSPLEKRWYTVLFPALQPGTREDVCLLSEWLCHATQRNGVEDTDGHFKDVETAFVLHSVAFLEVVRQVRIHCEERGDMILHVWRQLLRIFNQVMHRAEPKLTAMEDEVKRARELHEKEILEHAQTVNAMDDLRRKLKETEEHLRRVQMDIVRYKRCRLCLAGNMTPRTRESFVKKAMLKRFVGTEFGVVKRDKSRQELLDEALAETVGDGKDDKAGEADAQAHEAPSPTDVTAKDEPPTSEQSSTESPDSEQPKQGDPQAKGKPGEAESFNPKPTTVITFLRAALLKRSRRPTLDEVANQQIQNQLNGFVPKALAKPTVESSVQTDPVTISEVSKFAKVLKRSASCPARLRWKEVYDPLKAARHKQWLIDNGMIPEKAEQPSQEDEVEIVVASTASEEAATDGLDDIAADGKGGKMSKHMNRLANETMDLLAQMNDELAAEGETGAKVAALMKKWKKVARATSAFPIGRGADGAEAGEEGDEFDWEYEDEEDGKGRRRRKSKGKGRKEGEEGGELLPGQGRRSIVDPAEILKRNKRSTGRGQTFELGRTVPLGFAKMMDIAKPPKVIKFFNDRQLTKMITAVYTAKVEADVIDDAAGGDRQSSCEFVYDFMLNLYGLKRLAESAVWGLFKKIQTLKEKKEIQKCHKARIFNRFCGMDETKYYSERELYLYLKVMTKGNNINGLFYPSEQDDGISFVNCVWVESLATEPTLVSYMGSQAVALEFVQKFVATHATMDKVSLEVKKITKSERVKRIDFDELMEAIFEKGAADKEVVSVPKKPKKGVVAKEPLTTEQRLALENLFIAGDANQDGVLTFMEFREILNSANPQMSKQDGLRIFRETLLLEPEGGDKISPAAFATVAHKHDITAPPKVIFNLLKKMWLQIQGDINENKIKDEAAKKESNGLRTELEAMIEAGTDTNGAVQTFREFVLKFCGEDEKEGEEEQEDQEELEAEDDDTAVETLSEGTSEAATGRTSDSNPKAAGGKEPV